MQRSFGVWWCKQIPDVDESPRMEHSPLMKVQVKFKIWLKIAQKKYKRALSVIMIVAGCSKIVRKHYMSNQVNVAPNTADPISLKENRLLLLEYFDYFSPNWNKHTGVLNKAVQFRTQFSISMLNFLEVRVTYAHCFKYPRKWTTMYKILNYLSMQSLHSGDFKLVYINKWTSVHSHYLQFNVSFYPPTELQNFRILLKFFNNFEHQSHG